MTAPDRTAWTVAEDYDGDPTLWYGDIAILRQFELESHGLRRSELPIDLLWQVLTRVLAPDEATLMLLSHRVDSHALTLDDEAGRRDCVEDVLAALADSRDPLAALAGMSAQARHTAGDATGGGEHG